MECSPSRQPHHSRGGAKTCFSYQSLARIARKYNEANPQSAIPMSRSRDELWKSIRRRMPECKNERCFTRGLSGDDHSSVIEDLKPPIPEGKYVWLNSDDIDKVLYQYEKVFSTFTFLGTHPIDVQSVRKDVMSALKKALRARSMNSIAMVLNLDYHDQPGSHWVAVFIDKRNETFEYFDSFGEKAPREVRELHRSYAPDYRYRENKVVHQRKNSECGNYAINFIVQRLSGDSFTQTTRNIIRDEAMNGKRKIFFDPKSSYKSR